MSSCARALSVAGWVDCARHDLGSRVLQHTGTLKLVMEIKGQKDVKTAMKY
jgi:hypothetical protein